MPSQIAITCVKEHAYHILNTWNGRCNRPSHYCNPKRCYFYKTCDEGIEAVVEAARAYLNERSNNGVGVCETIW